MERYPWLNSHYLQLIKHYASGDGHNALLLHTNTDNSDDILAYAISRWLLCQQRHGDQSCDKCHFCRLMQAGNHPDYHLIIQKKGKNRVGVECVREVIEKLYSCAQQGGAKVLWLSQTEWLTEAAANALLKALEEPPENTYFILSCYEPKKLLATLRSRCLYRRLSNPNEQLSMQWLIRHAAGSPVDHITALRLKNGAPIAAQKLLQPEYWQQRVDLCNTVGTALMQDDIFSLLPLLHHSDVGERLNWLCTILIDTMKWQQGASNYIVNKDQESLVSVLASRLRNTSLLRVAQKWLLCRYQLLSVAGVNRELLLTEQLLSWKKTLDTDRSLCPNNSL